MSINLIEMNKRCHFADEHDVLAIDANHQILSKVLVENALKTRVEKHLSL